MSDRVTLTYVHTYVQTDDGNLEAHWEAVTELSIKTTQEQFDECFSQFKERFVCC